MAIISVDAALREACARAIVQPAAPDMGEVERLLCIHENVVRMHANGAEWDEAPEATRSALLDYVRGIVIALKIKTEEHDCCAEDLIALRSEAAQRPAGGVAIAQVIESGDYEAKVQWLLNPLPVGSVLYEEAQQPISAAEVPMPEPDRMRTGTDGELYGDWTEYQMIHYGDAREAAGYAAGVAAAAPQPCAGGGEVMEYKCPKCGTAAFQHWNLGLMHRCHVCNHIWRQS